MKCITFGYVLCPLRHYTPDVVGLSCSRSMPNRCLNGAARCLLQLLGCSVPYENVYAMDYLDADELLFREYRRDWFYHDYEHTHYACSHRASQFWMYKRGSLRGVISFSLVDYEEPQLSHHNFHHARLAEGVLDHAFFSDKQRRPILSLDPRQSLFRTSLPLVYISPQFSIEQAQ